MTRKDVEKAGGLYRQSLDSALSKYDNLVADRPIGADPKASLREIIKQANHTTELLKEIVEYCNQLPKESAINRIEKMIRQ